MPPVFNWLLLYFLGLLLIKHHPITLGCETCKVGRLYGFSYNQTACFVWFSERLPWLKAKLKCRESGGILARLHNKEVNTFVFKVWFFADLIRRDFHELKRDYPVARGAPPLGQTKSQTRLYHKNELWFGGIGLHPKSSTRWFWLLGGPFNFTSWGTGYSIREWTCLSARPGYVHRTPVMDNFHLFWYNSDCLVSLPFMCEYPTPQDEFKSSMKLLGADEHKTSSASSFRITIWVMPSFVIFLSESYNILIRNVI